MKRTYPSLARLARQGRGKEMAAGLTTKVAARMPVINAVKMHRVTGESLNEFFGTDRFAFPQPEAVFLD